MKLLPRLTLILCLHIPLTHSTPWIEDQRDRHTLFANAVIMSVGCLVGQIMTDLRDIRHYNNEIDTEGPSAQRIAKRDDACTRLTINGMTSALISILAGTYVLRDQIF